MNTIVVGLQFGDEGKGKIVDKLAAEHDWVVRYQGGANAGHTLYTEDGTKIVLHQVPSGVLQGKTGFIGNGCVVDLDALKMELEELGQQGYKINSNNLKVSPKAHVLTWEHKFADEEQNTKIGTTKRGIGPAYTDKVNRKGQRLSAFIINDVNNDYAWIKNHLSDPLPDLIRSGNVLFEGAQGTMLDVDHGTYPYVTSSNCTAGGACTGTGFPPNKIDKIIGVAKAYLTRVGNGPLPTELLEPEQTQLRTLGAEFGATTGRPRRCGWLDTVQLKYAATINGVDELYLTKLDVLYQMDTCYMYNGYTNGRGGFQEAMYFGDKAYQIYGTVPSIPYKFMPKEFKSFEEFAECYCTKVSEILGGTPIIASVGPKRNDLITFKG